MGSYTQRGGEEKTGGGKTEVDGVARAHEERELKYSMPAFHRSLVDNYAPRGYKELGGSKLKAPRIN